MKSNERKPLDPEGNGDWPWVEMWTIDDGKCTLCGECVDACTRHILRVENKKIRIKNQGECNWCGDCENVCGPEAIVLT